MWEDIAEASQQDNRCPFSPPPPQEFSHHLSWMSGQKAGLNSRVTCWDMLDMESEEGCCTPKEQQELGSIY